jgi:hypothetical protein
MGRPGRTLTVHTQILPGRHGAMFTEGALPEIRLVADDGTTMRPVRDHEDTAVFAHLTPGRYLVTAALRPCDGNCGYLDPATSHCTKVVHVSRDLTYAVTWKVGADCSVRAA